MQGLHTRNHAWDWVLATYTRVKGCTKSRRQVVRIKEGERPPGEPKQKNGVVDDRTNRGGGGESHWGGTGGGSVCRPLGSVRKKQPAENKAKPSQEKKYKKTARPMRQ